MGKFWNKNKKMFVFLVLMIITLNIPALFGDNLPIKNSGFELSSKNSELIPGWEINYWSKTPKQKIRISEERASQGKKSLKIYLQKPNPKNRFGFTIFQKLPIPDPAKNWRLSFDYWSDAKICLKLVVSSGPGNKIPYEFEFYHSKNDKKWHEASIELPAFKFSKGNVLWDKASVWLELCVYSKAKKLPATMFIDNVKICMVNKSKGNANISPKLSKRFRKVSRYAQEMSINAHCKDIKQKILKTKKVMRQICLPIIKASAKNPQISIEKNKELINTLNWAEQRLKALSSKNKNRSGLLKRCEIWRINPIQEKYPDPDSVVIDGKLTNEFKLTTAKDQFSPVCFLVNADKELNNISFEITPFVNAEGKVNSGVKADLRVIKWWYQDHGGRSGLERTGVKVLRPELLLHDDSLVKVCTKRKGNWLRTYNPELPAEYIRIDSGSGISTAHITKLPDKDAATLKSLNIKKGNNRLFWLLINSNKSAFAGKFSSQINILSGNTKIGTLNVKLHILPFILDKPSYYSSIYYRSPNYTNEIGYKPCYSEKQVWKQYYLEMKNLKEHGVDMPRFDRPVVQMNWKQWPYMKDLRKRLNIRKSLGMRTDILFLSYPIQNPQSSQDLKNLEDKVRKLGDELAVEGVKQLYFYGFDEARGKHLTSQRKAWEAVHRGGGKIFAAGFREENVHENMGDLLDLFVCEGTLSRQEANMWHKSRKKLGSYGNPQGGVENPELYRKNYGLRMWQCDYDAAMTYVYHTAPIQTGGYIIKSWNDFALNSDLMKQLMMVYPTAEGVIDTLQWEGYREGVNDLRYIAALERLCTREKSSMGNKKAIVEARKFLQELKKGDVTKDNVNLSNIRKQIINHIEQIIVTNK